MGCREKVYRRNELFCSFTSRLVASGGEKLQCFYNQVIDVGAIRRSCFSASPLPWEAKWTCADGDCRSLCRGWSHFYPSSTCFLLFILFIQLGWDLWKTEMKVRCCFLDFCFKERAVSSVCAHLTAPLLCCALSSFNWEISTLKNFQICFHSFRGNRNKSTFPISFSFFLSRMIWIVSSFLGTLHSADGFLNETPSISNLFFSWLILSNETVWMIFLLLLG